METINGVYKAECVRTTIFHDGPYKTIADVEFATAGWVDWYNHRRLHGEIGLVAPVEFEDAHYRHNPAPTTVGASVQSTRHCQLVALGQRVWSGLCDPQCASLLLS